MSDQWGSPGYGGSRGDGGYAGDYMQNGGVPHRQGPMPKVSTAKPFALYKEMANIGKTVESSKKRMMWRFAFGEDGDAHEVVLIHTITSGKKRLFVNGELIAEGQRLTNLEWSHGWPMGNHMCRVDILGEGLFELSIDALPFGRWPRLDPQLAAQMAAAKLDSERTLREDEQRRFDIVKRSNSGKQLGARKASTASTGGKDDKAAGGGARRGSTTDGQKKKPVATAAPAPIIDILATEIPPVPAPQQGFDPLGGGGGAATSSVGTAALMQLSMNYERMNIGGGAQPYQSLSPPPPQQQMFSMLGQQQQPSFSLFPMHGEQQQQEMGFGGSPVAPVVTQKTDDLYKGLVNIDGIGEKQTEKIVVKPITPDSRTLKEMGGPKRDSKQPVMIQREPPANAMGYAGGMGMMQQQQGAGGMGLGMQNMNMAPPPLKMTVDDAFRPANHQMAMMMSQQQQAMMMSQMHMNPGMNMNPGMYNMQPNQNMGMNYTNAMQMQQQPMVGNMGRGGMQLPQQTDGAWGNKPQQQRF